MMASCCRKYWVEEKVISVFFMFFKAKNRNYFFPNPIVFFLSNVALLSANRERVGHIFHVLESIQIAN